MDNMDNTAADNADQDKAKAEDTAWRDHLAKSIADLITTSGLSDPYQPPNEKRHTTLGTPCAHAWKDDWITQVDTLETRLARRICGARTLPGLPCELPPNHQNGRCRFHGGFNLTGAPQSNRNAVIHGLYSRRLRVCDASCPIWTKCPCAGNDVLDLAQRASQPIQFTCPYEQTEYNTALTDAIARTDRHPHPDPLTQHIAHNLALLQVMLNRAALALRNAPLTDQTTAATDNYHMQSQKTSALLDAFLRISAEYRRYATMLQPPHPQEPQPEHLINHKARTMADTQLDPDQAAQLRPSGFEGLEQARRYLREAMDHAAAGRANAALDRLEDACIIAPDYTALCEDKLLQAYRPNGKTPLEQYDSSYLTDRLPRRRHHRNKRAP